jgi:hypothetical protein
VPDYTAAYLVGSQVPVTAASSVTGGDPVEVAGNNQAQKVTANNSPRYLGIAGHDAVVGQRLSVIAAKPVHDGVADGAITAGDLLGASAAAGRTVRTVTAAAVAAQDVGATPTQASINTAVNAVGTALNASSAGRRIGVAMTTAADGQGVRWMQL